MSKLMIKLLAATAMFAAAATQAAPITDVQEFSNNTATEYFVDVDAHKAQSPYYRYGSADWGWSHNAIAGTFSSIKLDVSAYDVDFAQGEVDTISVFDGSSWLSIGNLAGANNAWAFTNFDLTGYAWAQAQVNAGLKVKMNIDANNGGWAVTLGKATLTVDGGNQTCVPTPGIPCTVKVAEPSSLGLLGLALLGFGLRRRKAK